MAATPARALRNSAKLNYLRAGPWRAQDCKGALPCRSCRTRDMPHVKLHAKTQNSSACELHCVGGC
eukprot:14663857-Alexandrium_andersonii.AAC.1